MKAPQQTLGMVLGIWQFELQFRHMLYLGGSVSFYVAFYLGGSGSSVTSLAPAQHLLEQYIYILYNPHVELTRQAAHMAPWETARQELPGHPRLDKAEKKQLKKRPDAMSMCCLPRDVWSMVQPAPRSKHSH